jgi:hypothetical protein
MSKPMLPEKLKMDLGIRLESPTIYEAKLGKQRA